MACNLEVVNCVFDCPLGLFICGLCENGLHSCYLKVETEVDFHPDKKRQIEAVIAPAGLQYRSIRENVHQWLKYYFYIPLSLKGPPFICEDSIKSSFHKKVWMTLAHSVAYGETITYGALAARIGKIGAAQAIGQAMAANPFQLIVPCHRVVPKTGQSGHYFRGTRDWLKTYLLNSEARKVNYYDTV